MNLIIHGLKKVSIYARIRTIHIAIGAGRGHGRSHLSNEHTSSSGMGIVHSLQREQRASDHSHSKTAPGAHCACRRSIPRCCGCAHASHHAQSDCIAQHAGRKLRCGLLHYYVGGLAGHQRTPIPNLGRADRSRGKRRYCVFPGHRQGRHDAGKITLAGASIAAFFHSLTQGLMLSDGKMFDQVLVWLVGSVAGRDLNQLAPCGRT